MSCLGERGGGFAPFSFSSSSSSSSSPLFCSHLGGGFFGFLDSGLGFCGLLGRGGVNGWLLISILVQLQDYWWVKGLLDQEAKRIAKEAMGVGYEGGRETTRERFKQVERIQREE